MTPAQREQLRRIVARSLKRARKRPGGFCGESFENSALLWELEKFIDTIARDADVTRRMHADLVRAIRFQQPLDKAA